MVSMEADRMECWPRPSPGKLPLPGGEGSRTIDRAHPFALVPFPVGEGTGGNGGHILQTSPLGEGTVRFSRGSGRTSETTCKTLPPHPSLLPSEPSAKWPVYGKSIHIFGRRTGLEPGPILLTTHRSACGNASGSRLGLRPSGTTSAGVAGISQNSSCVGGRPA